jgi:hypothetical protein
MAAGPPAVLALRGPRYKYVYCHGVWDIGEPYDLRTDPLGQHSLIGVPTCRDRADHARAAERKRH